MVKKKGGREMNPMDSYRKSQRAKEIAKNKRERQMQREAMTHVSDPSYLRKELKELLDQEEYGELNVAQKSRKKVLQRAYDAAIKKKMEEEAASKAANKDQQERAGGEHLAVDPSLANIPLPPMPQGQSLDLSSIPVPPLPIAGPPGAGWLPPPAVPPPQVHGKQRIPKNMLPPPAHPPPVEIDGTSASAVITGKSTVVPLPKAHLDKKLTSMVPASVQASRPKSKPATFAKTNKPASTGFGLVPRSVAAQKKDAGKQEDVPDNFDDFMKTLKNM